jgi:MFS family permease
LFGQRCNIDYVTVVASGERARPDWLRANPRAWIAAVVTVCFGAFMGQLDASVVALTYHSIGHDFGAGLGTVQWISLTYLAALGLLLVPIGRVSDRIGRKRMYLWGFGVFTLASAACALAPSLPALAALRAVQGAGAAMLQANSVAIVATAAPRRHLRRALGLQAAAQAVGLALGPTLGGLIVQTVGWRWVFALNVPVGVLAIVAGRYLLPRTRLDTGRRGGALREVLGRGRVAAGLVGALLAYLLLFGPIVLVPSVLQAHGGTPLAAGLTVASLPVGFALGALFGERILPRQWSAGRRCLAGVALTAGGLVGLLMSGRGEAGCGAALAAVGLGLGLFTPVNNAMVMSAAPARAAALTGGLVSAARAAGTALGTILVAGTVTLAANGAVSTWALLGVAVAAAATIPRRPDHEE